MHRSGTSSVSRVVNLLGGYLGEPNDLFGPRFDNPEGFWERKDIVELHDRLLQALSQRWDSPLPLGEDWRQQSDAVHCSADLKKIVFEAFNEQPFWAWKDPRTCLVFPLWRDVVTELGADLSVVYVLRHPIDVANSLATRDGFSREKSFGIWLNYNLSALSALEGIPTQVLSYDRLLDAPEQELRKFCEKFGILYPSQDDAFRETLDDFLRKDLRHSHSRPDKFSELPESVSELYRVLDDVACNRSEMDSNFFQRIESLFQQYRDSAKVFRWDMEHHFRNEGTLIPELKSDSLLATQQLADRDRQLADRDQQLADRDQQLADRDRQLADRDQQLADRDQQLADRDQQLADRDQQLADRDQANKEIKALFDEEQAERLRLVAQIDEIMNSNSWKFTRPLRALRKLLK